ncbi:LacI family DNA-binding transcriptional regulator [PVC group bacterium]|nr:LacI family DNA-binding transcriptional regulator [PVC group bacterium]
MKKHVVTLSDVAKQSGVSRTTAAKVLLGTGGDHVRVGDDARERVEKAAGELQYRPNRAAQRLAGGHTQTLGVLMNTVNAPVMNDRLAALEKEACQRGYRLLIGQIHGDLNVLNDYLFDFESRGVDAIFCLFDVTRGRVKRLTPIIGDRTDIVFHGKPLGDSGYCIRVDTAKAVAFLIDHLLKCGRRRIGLLLENMNDELMKAREDAYRSALKAGGLPIDTSLIWTAQSEEVNPTPDIIDDAIEHLVHHTKADAIVASNDIWAVQLIQGLKTRGYRVPKDVAVTGYDNLDISTIIEPSLTTIDQQHRQYAKAAIDMLVTIAKEKGKDLQQRIVTTQPRLIVRESTSLI